MPLLRPSGFVALVSLCLLSSVACSSEASSDSAGGSSLVAKPRAIGDVNRIAVVADPQLLQTPVGDSILYHYEQAYPMMPQPEPLYDLRYMTVEDLQSTSARRELRNYLIVADIGDESSPTTQFVRQMLGEEKFLAAREDWRRGTTVATDTWANGQLVVYVYAEGPDKVADLVARSFAAASKRIASSDQEVLMANIYQAGRAEQLIDSLQRTVGITMDIPLDYQLAKVDSNFMWLRRDLSDVVQNILISSVDYRDASQLSPDSAVVYRNRIARDAVRTNTVGSVMATNDRDLPLVTDTVEIAGVSSIEVRGVWEMSDDFMGGPFFTYLIPDPEAGKLYIIDGFVYAPGSKKGKRNYMQQIATIVSTTEM